MNLITFSSVNALPQVQRVRKPAFGSSEEQARRQLLATGLDAVFEELQTRHGIHGVLAAIDFVRQIQDDPKAKPLRPIQKQLLIDAGLMDTDGTVHDVIKTAIKDGFEIDGLTVVQKQ